MFALKTVLFVQNESRPGVENVEKIVAVEGLDGILIGPLDLSKQMGVERGGEEDEAAIQRVLTAANFMALIVGSAFYGSPDTTAGFASKGGLLFFAGLLNTFTAMSKINNLYSQSLIVVKQASYTFYHPSTEAIAGVIGDILVKFVVAVVFNTIMYFMGYLRREASQFFIYFLITFVIMIVMSAVFRTMAAVTKTISQAIGLAEVLIVALIVGCGSGIGGWVEAV
ncbi:uncharacterized protein CDV56_109383 [Aspergillus thermomutatus]|uniref:ABC-2 type transporter transmembrane domain-containing protein n=1 Tax=Aspergillus thermomutatus TaxID=41047 RepID=A0A397HPL5_ASPTH|nr:uncharacterized protein CDV56_109383 [Aspergillus thermomutatus]RHZ64962.1 hypothetical protein CDV56_109383 [Aspergillus thermomutatus]